MENNQHFINRKGAIIKFVSGIAVIFFGLFFLFSGQILIGLILGIGGLILLVKSNEEFTKKEIKCPNCQYEGEAMQKTKGSLVIEIILWFFFLIPGLIYSCWRYNSRHYPCPKCGYQYTIKKN